MQKRNIFLKTGVMIIKQPVIASYYWKINLLSSLLVDLIKENIKAF